MGNQQLDNLVRIGQLKSEPQAEAEIQGLVRSGLRRPECKWQSCRGSE